MVDNFDRLPNMPELREDTEDEDVSRSWAAMLSALCLLAAVLLVIAIGGIAILLRVLS